MDTWSNIVLDCLDVYQLDIRGVALLLVSVRSIMLLPLVVMHVGSLLLWMSSSKSLIRSERAMPCGFAVLSCQSGCRELKSPATIRDFKGKPSILSELAV
ncbi:hypothetical protein DERP_005768 [Dermatophagoides pteronyssinus]|uniref:Uncharacterized protein n=1 Tax=Dermatophagoides pteronyssinus TaxID=6956 RepID=A0ABQ8JA72_DERPT|nr:hypothetical protein DERP_005768 [Dermatophagoides pteronyssinus]